ncbi:hypothetical protein EPN90_03360 [Patescibacteria group bacterium]|nr:MAG: hypothetical protein EPN90_03360 [Patescibacteria group bacterium]
MTNAEINPLTPRELLGGLYEKVFPPLAEKEAFALLAKFAKEIERGAQDYRRAGDRDGAETTEDMAKRFRTLAEKETITAAEFREIEPWIETAAERAKDAMHRATITERVRHNAATKRWSDLERLRAFLEKKVSSEPPRQRQDGE